MPVSAKIARASFLIGCLVALVSLRGCLGGGDSDREARPADVAAPNDVLELSCRLQEGSGSSRSDPRFREKSVVIGPVVFFPARSEYPRQRIEELTTGRFPLAELLIALTRDEIATGETATVRLVGPASSHAAFFSSRVRYKPRGYRISEGFRAVVARACEVGPGFHLYTTYNVGFLADSARCVPIAVSVEGQRNLREVVRFATRECS